MVAITPHRSTAPECMVDGLRQTDRQSLTSAADAVTAVGLDDQVDVIGLYAEMKYPEARAGGRGEGAADSVEERTTAQR